MIADLYLDEKTFLKSIQIHDGCHMIRIMSSGPIRAASVMDPDGPARAAMHIWRYEAREYVGPGRIKFLFAGIETSDMSVPETSFDVGFEEPTEKVNLDILKNRLRDNKKVKDLLLKFYRKS